MLMVTRKETWLPFYLVIVYFIIKNYKNKAWLILLFLILTLIASDQLSVLIKNLVMRFRPVHEPDVQNMVHNVLRKGGLYGFVSSHASNTFAIYVFTSRIFKNRRYSLILLFWTLLICYSRIYSGVHYPLDILGGVILGAILAGIFYKILMFFENHFFIARNPIIQKTFLTNPQVGIVFLVFLVLSTTVFLVTSILHHYNYL